VGVELHVAAVFSMIKEQESWESARLKRLSKENLDKKSEL